MNYKGTWVILYRNVRRDAMNTKGVMISEICNLCKYYGKIKKMKIQSYPYLL
jgi:hypothetical protein